MIICTYTNIYLSLCNPDTYLCETPDWLLGQLGAPLSVSTNGMVLLLLDWILFLMPHQNITALKAETHVHSAKFNFIHKYKPAYQTGVFRLDLFKVSTRPQNNAQPQLRTRIDTRWIQCEIGDNTAVARTMPWMISHWNRSSGMLVKKSVKKLQCI